MTRDQIKFAAVVLAPVAAAVRLDFAAYKRAKKAAAKKKEPVPDFDLSLLAMRVGEAFVAGFLAAVGVQLAVEA